MSAHEIEREKRKTFSSVFGGRCAVELLGLQVWNDKSDERLLAEVSFRFGDFATAQEIENLCEDVAAWIGGSLFGTVNLDFSGTHCSLSMMVEFP
ncbi:MAG: hypothetical protein IKQ17_11405 [Kiritimatiellae bacterium]|nr:hypothetical protein [Kiritimatiellia bacterium]